MTIQTPEILWIEREQTPMACALPLPHGEKRILTIPYDEFNGPTVCRTTACWRGYIGTWKIKDRKLYLMGLEGFLRLAWGPPIFAEWITATLRVPRGDLAEWHSGHDSVYVLEQHIDVERGIVVARRLINTGHLVW